MANVSAKSLEERVCIVTSCKCEIKMHSRLSILINTQERDAAADRHVRLHDVDGPREGTLGGHSLTSGVTCDICR